MGLDDRGRWRAGRSYLYIDRRYADAVAAAGGLPVQLPIQDDAPSLVEGLDGLLVPGGDDLPPDAPLPADVELDLVPQEQLAFDTALLREALERGLPVLAICYGMQLLARLAGGRLVGHLPTERPDAGDHRLPEPDGRHPIELEPDSRLARALGSTRCEVNSLHHQAIEGAGPGQRVVARSPDGVIEGIEAERGYALGVQWHPEKLETPESERLFADFVAACSRAED